MNTSQSSSSNYSIATFPGLEDLMRDFLTQNGDLMRLRSYSHMRSLRRMRPCLEESKLVFKFGKQAGLNTIEIKNESEFVLWVFALDQNVVKTKFENNEHLYSGDISLVKVDKDFYPNVTMHVCLDSDVMIIDY